MLTASVTAFERTKWKLSRRKWGRMRSGHREMGRRRQWDLDLDEWWEKMEEAGCARCCSKSICHPESLISVGGGGCLVINRLQSACSTGGSLGFDGRTLISPQKLPEDKQIEKQTDLPKQARYFIRPPPAPPPPTSTVPSLTLFKSVLSPPSLHLDSQLFMLH